ncbi:MAG: hypothetical protein KF802_00350 [Bdellovibrionaceae bacterium]|nr:hypothetical protein [Pseudobdellovibrionaceae bacterium]
MQKICASLLLAFALCTMGCATKEKKDCACGGHGHAHEHKHEHKAGEKHDCTKGECQIGTGSK